MPVELWQLCAVDHHGIGHRIESFCARVDAAHARAYEARLAGAADGSRPPAPAGVGG
jgi:hypothetical protein